MEEVRWMHEMTWPEFSELVKETDIALIPAGVMEEHGHHGPLGVDTFAAEEMAKRIARRVKAVTLPVMPYGHSEERFDTSAWPGTISISPETTASFYRELGEELVRHGLRRILFVSGHYNNNGPLTTAAFRIWKETGAAVGLFEWFIAVHDEAYELTELIHADQVETSIILASDKAHLVKMDRAVVNPLKVPAFDDEKELWKRFMFDRYTFSADESYLYKGNFCDPTKATKEIGDRLLDLSADRALIMIEALKKHVNEKKIKRYRESFI